MAIIPHPVRGSYDDFLFETIAESEGFVPRVYSDHRGIPTLGLGYALLVDAPGWPPRAGLDADLAAVGITLTEADRALLTSVAGQLSRGAVSAAKESVPAWLPGEVSAARNVFGFLISRAQGKDLFERIRPEYESVLEKRLGSALLQSLAGSQELVVLFSLAYNSPALIGPGLSAALRDGAREKAWYEIRFGSNRDRHRGLQNRRDHEAELFGALNAEPTVEERAAFLALLAERRDKITRYLGQVGLGEAEIQTTLAGLEDSGSETRLA